ncbi:unnamed protein product [Alternaria alternata]
MATRVTTPYFRLGQDEDFPALPIRRQRTCSSSPIPIRVIESPLAASFRRFPARDVRGDHAKGIRELGAAGTVLLKNLNNTLPLSNETSFGLFGNDLPDPTIGSVFRDYGNAATGYPMGTLDIGGGSGTVRSLGGRVQWLFDNDEIADGKAFATEGSDRADLDFQWNATLAVESTAKLCPKTVVVTHGPEPSGRLPYSIPKAAADYGPPIVELPRNVTDPDAWQADYIEGQLIDYRRFDANDDLEPHYEFGFGLSYTSFVMSHEMNVELRGTPLTPVPDESKGIAPGGLRDLWTVVAVATVNITNNGGRAGSAVPQLYLSLPQDTTPVGTPVKVLRGFEKVHLLPGETQTVTFDLMRRDVSFWDVDSKTWTIPAGSIRFTAGFSAKDLHAVCDVVVLV